MTQLTIRDLPLKNKRVLMRVDFNVPIENGEITDDSKIRAALPTIEYAIQQGACVILMSHLGRPKSKPSDEFSLTPCFKRLSELLQSPVSFANDCVGKAVEGKVKELQRGQVLLLENLRFHVGEEKPEQDPDFVKQLAALGDCYVNDAFGSAHRAHASTAWIAKQFPHLSAMGFLMEKEIAALSPLVKNPVRPFFTIIGGSKISTKIGLINNLLKHVDALFIGGAMAFTFFKAKGISIGTSLVEDPKTIDNLPMEKIYLPMDLVIADRFSNEARRKVIDVKQGIPDGWQGMDIGPKTITSWTQLLSKGRTIFWNGPVGVFEMPHFLEGTRALAKYLSQCDATTIIGGGDSVAAIQKMGLQDRFAHLSTGGGASLEFLEFGHLPGIDALSQK